MRWTAICCTAILFALAEGRAEAARSWTVSFDVAAIDALLPTGRRDVLVVLAGPGRSPKVVDALRAQLARHPRVASVLDGALLGSVCLLSDGEILAGSRGVAADTLITVRVSASDLPDRALLAVYDRASSPTTTGSDLPFRTLSVRIGAPPRPAAADEVDLTHHPDRIPRDAPLSLRHPEARTLEEMEPYYADDLRGTLEATQLYAALRRTDLVTEATRTRHRRIPLIASGIAVLCVGGVSLMGGLAAAPSVFGVTAPASNIVGGEVALLLGAAVLASAGATLLALSARAPRDPTSPAENRRLIEQYNQDLQRRQEYEAAAPESTDPRSSVPTSPRLGWSPVVSPTAAGVVLGANF